MRFGVRLLLKRFHYDGYPGVVECQNLRRAVVLLFFYLPRIAHDPRSLRPLIHAYTALLSHVSLNDLGRNCNYHLRDFVSNVMLRLSKNS